MTEMIDFVGNPMRTVLPLFLQDKSTKKYIIWATDPPDNVGEDVTDKSQITVDQIAGSKWKYRK